MTIATIVCVDDQPEVRRLLADVFRQRGSNVVSFDDGEDAIGWLGGNDADLAILDLDLGPNRRSGIEICRGIRALPPATARSTTRSPPSKSEEGRGTTITITLPTDKTGLLSLPV